MRLKPYIRKASFHETDAMGIIHHSNYIRWFEEARVDFMDQIGYSYAQAAEMGVDFAVLGVACDYKIMVRFGDSVSIRSEIVALSPSRMTVRYRVTDTATGGVCTLGESRHCYLDSATKRPVSLKKALPELYAMFEEIVCTDFD